MSCGHVLIDHFCYTDCHRRRGECGIEVIPANCDRMVVIATELQDNPGMSIQCRRVCRYRGVSRTAD